jgi:hypothetical protein
LLISSLGQLALKYNSRCDGCDGRNYGEQRSNSTKYDCYLLSPFLLVTLGFATFAVGFYCIMYRREALVAGVVLEFGGGFAFLISLAASSDMRRPRTAIESSASNQIRTSNAPRHEKKINACTWPPARLNFLRCYPFEFQRCNTRMEDFF